MRLNDRIILHSDLNNFYASVEMLYNSKLANKPLAVSGDPDKRHGIVLAKNESAKKYGVKTGETLWSARSKCPDIVFVKPHFDRYIQVSRLVRDIYYEYTDLIEPFGIDECWLDVTQSTSIFGSGESIALAIKQRIKNEIGVTVSIGVSFNKIFAKLASDMKKPDAITVISKEEFRSKIWRLSIGELLYAGRATRQKLARLNIKTIGDMARADSNMIEHHLGKNGIMLQKYARGLDNSPVREAEESREVKSIGNGTTLPFDLTCIDDVKVVIMLLSESVATRLREKGLYCTAVNLGIKFDDLSYIDRRFTLPMPVNSATDIFKYACKLFMAENITQPVRALSVRGCNLTKCLNTQGLLFNKDEIVKKERLNRLSDTVRGKYGRAGIQKGIMLVNRELSMLNPNDDNTLQKIAFFKG